MRAKNWSFVSWIGLEIFLCVTICIMSCRSSFNFVCIPKSLFGSSVQEYQVVFNWYFSYFYAYFCSLTCELVYIVCGIDLSSTFVLFLVQIVPHKPMLRVIHSILTRLSLHSRSKFILHDHCPGPTYVGHRGTCAQAHNLLPSTWSY